MIPQVEKDGTRFRVWAPRAGRVALRVAGMDPPGGVPMDAAADGHFEAFRPGVGGGARYHYLIDGRELPDPASAFQPEGVHGPSQVVDFNALPRADDAWPGVRRQDLVIYEVHVGTFTAEGTFLAAIDRLDEVVDLGATAVELMPVAGFPGRWNWGYDGVALFAPTHNYGSPADLRRLVDACHARGIAVILDVVYNHLGPEGNYLAHFAPYFGPDKTPWGEAPAFTGKHGDQVRAFFRANAVHWITRYRFDGLRFDAIAAIRDDCPVHIINQIGGDLKWLAAREGREILTFGESNLYQPEFLAGSGGALDALWSDDLGHAALSAVTGEGTYGGRPYAGFSDLAETLARGYLYRRGRGMSPVRVRGEAPRADLEACVNQLQNHDIVGNTPDGRRIHQRTSPEMHRALAALVLLYPSIPLIFMGEDFGADAPFLFFTDFGDSQLRRAVEKGRARELPHADSSRAVPPTSAEAFLLSRLPPVAHGDAATRAWYRGLIRLRREWREAGLLRASNMEVEADAGRSYCLLRYTRDGREAHVLSVLHTGAAPLQFEGSETLCFHSGAVERTGPVLSLGAASSAVGHGRLTLSG